MAAWIVIAAGAASALLPLPQAPSERAAACEMTIFVAAEQIILESPNPDTEARLNAALIAWRERAEALAGYDEARHLADMEALRERVAGQTEALETCLAEVEK
ncbi:MAG TPA: hypothetical protein VF138_01340 [Caulobacteraceae bacterium]